MIRLARSISYTHIVYPSTRLALPFMPSLCTANNITNLLHYDVTYLGHPLAHDLAPVHVACDGDGFVACFVAALVRIHSGLKAHHTRQIAEARHSFNQSTPPGSAL